MAKSPSDKLHRLIRSLTPAEKRHFHVFIGSAQAHSKYALLFDAMASMERFDDEALRQRIYPDDPQSSQRYSELKIYLFDLVLKSLQAYDAERSAEFRLNHLLQSAAVLYRRGHYGACQNYLYKAEKLAQRYESFSHLLDVVRWQRHLAYTQMDVDLLHKQLDLLQARERDAAAQLAEIIEYRNLFFQAYLLVKREALLHTEKGQEQLRALRSHPLLQRAEQARSHTARVLCYRTLNLCYYAAGEREAFYHSGRHLVSLLESQPHFLRENQADYIAALSNYILSCGLTSRYDEVEKTLDKLKRIKPLTRDDALKIHRQYYTNKFALCIYTGAFDEGRREMEHCQQEATLFASHEYETASFYFQYCYICFGCADYDRALTYLNAWNNQPRTLEREDLQSLGRILAMALHFDMGNTLLLESLLRSTAQLLRRKKRLYELERRFFHGMSELLNAPNAAAQRAVFQKMQQDIRQLANQPEAYALLQTFDLEAWVEAKAHGRSFASVVRDKWRRQNAGRPG
ncbi:MAG: hypothetical protein RMJ33_02440 [Saprospiraceae bacterium]|nr:hypothetical protein [Saprospiraceae bacterium]MDW8228674.1 hypothetical protein [Saprospiraceae bacterium]